MKRRITFLVSPYEDDEAPEDPLRLSEDALEIKGLKAIREDHFTLTFDELPQFVKDVVEQTQKLHVRFDNGGNTENDWLGPFESRLPLGVHIFAVPLKESKMTNLCSFISKYADIPCSSIEANFISRGQLKQFYAPDVDVLSNILKPLANKICGPSKKACKDKVLALRTATSLDLNYDSASNILDVNAIWMSPHGSKGKGESWDLQIKPGAPGDRVEVGVFTSGGKSPSEEELSLRGKLAVVGRDDELKPVHFSFASRHHFRRGEMHIPEYSKPTAGLHPKVEVSLSTTEDPPADGCTLNAYFTVPQPFFVDPYQLEDDKLMKSYGIKKVKAVEGETDLEAPVWAMSKWGAIVLVELEIEHHFRIWKKIRHHLKFTLPFHLRYMPTHPEKHKDTAILPAPAIFWACPSEQWSRMSKNPFDRRMLGYEEYFPEETYFYHLPPRFRDATLSRWSLDVPILNSVDSQLIEWGTMGIVVLGFLWVFGAILTSFLGFGRKKVEEHQKKE
ncbi:protease B nonderepressible form [Arthrobotrys musiformis]|uniref:Protein PBN1 n=1 Tax=Arthrobotrys musiformis TaxID=47236 RepID=A0AAV9WDI1_9PEZI